MRVKYRRDTKCFEALELSAIADAAVKEIQELPELHTDTDRAAEIFSTPAKALSRGPDPSEESVYGT